MDFPLDELSNLEQSFYNSGYEDGFAHGRIHGLIEGRSLGKEKGFEIWEEVGFYRGFALFWIAVIKSGHPVDEKRKSGGGILFAHETMEADTRPTLAAPSVMQHISSR
ncbi:hypothetical protein FS837_002966 [Tulasnella sp. UAMH 9824]|nr:hypothetical protein FS837_002966 [Tulasnella sp. UAMH 9824]